MTVCVLGSINLDTVMTVSELPRAGETITAQRLQQFPGGKGANQAIACARMGARTLMIGAVGRDEAGTGMYRYLQQTGVDISGVKIDPEYGTGQAFINVSVSGENLIVIVTGANSAVSPQDIDTDLLQDKTVFLAQLETPLDSIRALFSTDAAVRGITLLNAAPALAEATDLFELVDILIVNETELATYAGLQGQPESEQEIVTAAKKLIRHDAQTIVITLGARGAVVLDLTRSWHIPGRRVQVIDTTGAGDCFCGVLAAGLGSGRALADALNFAVIAASISVQRAGAATSMPDHNEVEQVIIEASEVS